MPLRHLNSTARDWGLQAIARGDFDATSTWSWSVEDEDQLLGNPPDWEAYRQKFLGRDPGQLEQAKAGWSYPFARAVDGKVIVHRTALDDIRRTALEEGEDDIRTGAQELLDELDKLADATPTGSGGADGGNGGGDGGSSGGGGKGPSIGGTAAADRPASVRSVHFREAVIERSAIDVEKRTVELTFSSETEIETFWWDTFEFVREILDHDAASVRLTRLQTAGALLVAHDRGDQVGVVERVWIGSDRRGHAVVRFGKSARAQEIFQDVVDRIRRTVSFGYWIYRAVLEDKTEGRLPLYRAIDWEPFEVTLEPVPADISVGVDRQAAPAAAHHIEIMTRAQFELRRAGGTMQRKHGIQIPRPDDTGEGGGGGTAVTITREDLAEQARKEEITRIRRIDALGAQFGQAELARTFIDQGKPVKEFQDALLERMGRQKPAAAVVEGNGEIGLSRKEAQRFSLLRAMNFLANPHSVQAREAAAFELECSQAVCKRYGKETGGVFMPAEAARVRMRYGRKPRRRDITASTATQGAELVATEVMSLTEFMENRSVVMGLATVIRDLEGNLSWPRQVTSPAAGYVGTENAQNTELTITFGATNSTPKLLSGTLDVSGRLFKQSSLDAEALVRRWAGTKLGLGVDLAAITGSGAGGNPRGINNTTGVGTVTTGAAITHAHVVEFETAVAVQNGDVGRLAYVTNAVVRGKCKTTAIDAGSGIMLWKGNELNGYPALVSNQVPSNLGGGADLSEMIFGNWEDLIIMMWGAIETVLDPYTKARENLYPFTFRVENDIHVLHGESFSIALDIAA